MGPGGVPIVSVPVAKGGGVGYGRLKATSQVVPMRQSAQMGHATHRVVGLTS